MAAEATGRLHGPSSEKSWGCSGGSEVAPQLGDELRALVRMARASHERRPDRLEPIDL